MDLTTFLSYCLTGISIGGIYALIAIGYTMVYGILRLINFAHGDIFMMAAYFMIFAMVDFMIPWYLFDSCSSYCDCNSRCGNRKSGVQASQIRTAYVDNDFCHRCVVSASEHGDISFFGTAEVISVNRCAQQEDNNRRCIDIARNIYNTDNYDNSGDTSFDAHKTYQSWYGYESCFKRF